MANKLKDFKPGELCKVSQEKLGGRILRNRDQSEIRGIAEVKVTPGSWVEVIQQMTVHQYETYLLIWVPAQKIYVSFAPEWLEKAQ